MIGMVIQPGMEQLIESVRDGTLDFMLTKLVDAQLLISVRRIEIWQLTDILLRLGVLVAALVRLAEKIGAWQAAAFLGIRVSGAIIIYYSFWLILATLSFWFVRVANILIIFQSMRGAGCWHISLYLAWLRFALTFMVPATFVTTVPAAALTSHLSRTTLLETMILSIILFMVSQAIWQVGLQRYSGATA